MADASDMQVGRSHRFIPSRDYGQHTIPHPPSTNGVPQQPPHLPNQRSPGLPLQNPSCSFWSYPPPPSLLLPTHADLVVVSSGITGTSVSCYVGSERCMFWGDWEKRQAYLIMIKCDHGQVVIQRIKVSAS
ncbi:hypothetical protein EV702DRAFT_1236291 [Suillus placidus]|uniref:Uncharacterized protein n=1 Tax=Suillus placidus TaxID=48579 RepID=A0A9P6ZRP3_9AGAM|nr:hypothetical protein EV702DRAFT_1236291 [Suillus placidus]